LKAEVKHVNGDANTTDQVTKQDPAAGTEVDSNSTVTITVNDGPKTAKIPGGLKGDGVADAEAALKKKKFSNVTTRAAADEPSDAKASEVLSVVPAEGSTVPLDQKITLTYATGKSKVPVLTGKTPAQAESDARTAGFTKFNRDEVQTNNEPAGVVFEQNPQAGTTVVRSTTISYKVAVAPPQPGPPTVTTTTTERPTRTPTQSPSPSPSATESSAGG
jgi:serine/threonine-protein kinase